jgi:hypothetical protein
MKELALEPFLQPTRNHHSAAFVVLERLDKSFYHAQIVDRDAIDIFLPEPNSR